jgi:Zn-dependent protease with chaperone function
MRRLGLLAGFVLFAAIGFTCAAAAPAEKGRNQAREKAVLAELEALAPDAVAGFIDATKALDASEWGKAADGYRRVLERAPGFDAATRRLGSCLVEGGQRAEGIRLHESALETRRSSANLFSLGLALSQAAGTGLAKAERGDLVRALDLMDEAARLEPTDPDPLFVKAQVSLELQELDRFREAVDSMRQMHPDLFATHYFAAVRAAIDEEWREAELEIREAGRLGLPPEDVERFLATGVSSRAAAWRWAIVIACAAGLWALGLLALFVLGRSLSSATVASIERDDPNETVTSSSMRLRSIYRRVVTVAGYYWYLSQPFVAILVLAAAAAVLYAFLVIGRIPIKLVAILVIGTLVSLFAIVRSLFVRIRDDDPGRAVREDEAPALWAAARDVAAQVGTRPVDEIWMTPGTDLAVMERGGARARLEDRGRRALILGAGVLDGFRQGPFRAVLAHEYGHFAHRDTAGGDVAIRVTGGIQTFAVALGQAGFAVWWNLAFQFLRLYDFLFRRISHGATRPSTAAKRGAQRSAPRSSRPQCQRFSAASAQPTPPLKNGLARRSPAPTPGRGAQLASTAGACGGAFARAVSRPFSDRA